MLSLVFFCKKYPKIVRLLEGIIDNFDIISQKKEQDMKILLLFLSPLFICAGVHYAKAEPFESMMLKSAVSGLVDDVDLDAEGLMVHERKIIHIDDALDKVNLDSSKKSAALLHKMLSVNKEIAKSLKSTVERQQSYYSRISKLSTASKTQKDSAFSAFSSAKTQYLSTKEKILNLEKQILDIEYKIEQLKDTIAKKSVILHDAYLYKIMVKKGDFVAPGSLLAQVMDMHKAKLVLFLEPEEMKDLESKSVYIDGEKTAYRVDKVWKVADEKFISSYRAEIYIDAPKDTFSKLLKVEIKQ